MKRKKLYKRVFSVMMAAILLLAMLPQGTYAETKEPITINIRSGDFSKYPPGRDGENSFLWQRGNGAVDPLAGGLFLTDPVQQGETNLVVKRNKVKINNGFSSYFTLGMTAAKNDPADGMTFFVQKGGADGPIIGEGGSNFGYGYSNGNGDTQSFAVEFDIYNSGGSDPNANHVAILEAGSIQHDPAQTVTPSFPLYNYDLKMVHVWVDYKPTGELKVTVNDTKNRSGSNAVTLNKNVGTNLITDQGVYVGFSAASGPSTALQHAVYNWYFDNNYVSDGLSSKENAYEQGADTSDNLAVNIAGGSGALNPVNADIALKDSGNNAIKNRDVTIYIDGVSKGIFNTGESGTITYPINYTGLPDGEHTLKAVASGGATGSSTFKSQDITPPTVPTVTITSPVGYTDGSWTASDVAFTVGASTDAQSGVKEYQYSTNNDSNWSTGSSGTINSTGKYSLVGKAIDNVGNKSGISTAKSVWVDKTAPNSFTLTAEATATDKISISGSTTDANSGLDDQPYAFNNGTSWSEWTAEDSAILEGYTPNQQVTVQMKARDAVGNETVSTKTLHTLAKVPAIDSLKANSNGSVELTVEEYDNSGNTKYYVEKSTNPNFPSGSDTTVAKDWIDPATDHTITIDGLDRGTQYYFRIKAKNNDGIETVFGKITGSIQTIPADIIEAPTVEAVSTNQLNIGWKATKGATSYDVFRNGSFFKNVTGTSTTDSILSPNTGNIYTIKGKNSSGISLNASPASAIKYTFPTSPGITLQPFANGTEVKVTVVPNGNAEGTQYYIEYGETNDFTGASNSTWSTGIERTISGLTSGTTYNFRVKARNGNDGANTDKESAWSQVSNTVTALSIGTLTATPESSSSIKLTWPPVDNAKSYKIYRDGNLLETTTEPSFTDKGLKANKQYTYKVTAINNANAESLPSIEKSVYTHAEYPESASAIGITNTSINLNVMPNTNLGNPEQYQLIVKKKADGSIIRQLAWSPNLEYEITELVIDTEYEIWADVRNNEKIARGPIKLIDSIYTNRPVSGDVTNDIPTSRSEQIGYNDNFTIDLKAWDPDGKTITASAEINGFKVTKSIVAPTTEPSNANLQLKWDPWTLPEGSYKDVVVTITDGYDSTITKTFASTLTIDKTAPTLTLNGDSVVYIAKDGTYTEQKATAVDNGLGLDGDVTIIGEVKTETPGEYVITYKATDKVGNTSTVSRKVYVGMDGDAVGPTTVSNIGATAVNVSSEITTFGPDNKTTDYGFVYGTSNNLTIDTGGKVIVAEPSLGVNSVDVTNLSPETKYFVRSYIKKDDGTYVYGEETSFTTGKSESEKPRFAIEKAKYTVNENEGSLSVTVTRSVKTNEEISIDYSTANRTAAAASDYTATSGTLTFAAGDTAKTIIIPITNDNNFEEDETFTLALSNASKDSFITSPQAMITIKSDDAKSSGKEISNFTLAGVNGDIKQTDGTITLTVPYGTKLEGISPSIINISEKATVSPSTDTLRDFTNPIVYTVIAEDGTTKIYKVLVEVAPQAEDANLFGFTVKNGQNVLNYSPAFTKENTDYTLNVGNDVEDIMITPVSNDPKAVIRVNGEIVTGNTEKNIPLSNGTNIIVVQVTAEDGKTTKSYTIKVTKAEPEAGSNVNLASLSTSEGTLTPSFDPAKTDYTVYVPNRTSTISVSASLEDNTSTMVMKANGNVISNGDTFSLNVGPNVVSVKVTSSTGITKSYAISITRGVAETSPGGGGGGGSSSPVAPTTPTTNTDNTIVLVNGKVESIGKSETTTKGNQTQTVLSIDEKKLQEKLEAEGNNSTVTIPVADTKADVIIGELNGQMVKNMENKQATVVVQTPTASYTLPAEQINIDAIAQQIGRNIRLQDIKINIEIAKPQAETIKVVENAAQKGNFSIMVPPVDFKVTYFNGDQTGEVKRFNAYVERTIAIPDGVDPNKITTGIVVNPDGTSYHVPTQVIKIGEKYYAKINSLTNSTYSVVWNPREFSDVATHWAKDSINNLGSRMVINGVTSETFAPNKDITRAEFAAIMVRALGLKPGVGEAAYSDIAQNAWYTDYIQTATDYKLIKGYENGKFGPNDKITRQQAIAIIARATTFTKLHKDLSDEEADAILAKYNDASQIADYAKENIALAIQTGIANGRSNGTIAPRDFITRAEVAAIVERLLKKSDLINK